MEFLGYLVFQDEGSTAHDKLMTVNWVPVPRNDENSLHRGLGLRIDGALGVFMTREILRFQLAIL